MRLALLLLATGCINDPTLFVERSGEGTGRVTSDPKGIDCGQTCGLDVPGGRVTLTAVPGENSYLAGWTGACEDSLEPTCSFEVIDQMHVTADFGLAPQMLTIIPSAGGRVTAPGLDCGETCSVEYPFATDVLITATPDPGLAFGGWADGSMNTTRFYTMNKAVTLEARFIEAHVLTIVLNGTGYVYSNPNGIHCGSTCAAPFDEGTLITLVPSDLGVSFAGWTGCPSGTQNTCVLTITGDTEITATFN